LLDDKLISLSSEYDTLITDIFSEEFNESFYNEDSKELENLYEKLDKVEMELSDMFSHYKNDDYILNVKCIMDKLKTNARINNRAYSYKGSLVLCSYFEHNAYYVTITNIDDKYYVNESFNKPLLGHCKLGSEFNPVTYSAIKDIKTFISDVSYNKGILSVSIMDNVKIIPVFNYINIVLSDFFDFQSIKGQIISYKIKDKLLIDDILYISDMLNISKLDKCKIIQNCTFQ